MIRALMIALSASAAEADMFEDFTGSPETRWEYVADTVMGGVSAGDAVFETVDGRAAVRLTGEVSTENNGGFIQVRRMLAEGLPADTAGLVMDVTGNGETYYLFIRTRDLTRPWYYYSAAFSAGEGWDEVKIPLSAFERSHAHLAETIEPGEVASLGIVAYGRDYTADLAVGSIALY